MAADLVNMNVDVIVTPSAGLASLARKATLTTPIIVLAAGELEGTGLIASLRRPGGNVTGLQILSPELIASVSNCSKNCPKLRATWSRRSRYAGCHNHSRYLEHIAEAANALQIQASSSRGP